MRQWPCASIAVVRQRGDRDTCDHLTVIGMVFSLAMALVSSMFQVIVLSIRVMMMFVSMLIQLAGAVASESKRRR